MQRKGLYSILEFSNIYKLIQSLFFHQESFDVVISFIGDFSNKNILDIGCGPGDFSKNFSSARYFGIDISEDYIQSARKNYGNYGKFYCKSVSDLSDISLPNIDIVIMRGVLHHLSDEEVQTTLKLLIPILNSGAKLVSIDPVLLKRQNRIAKIFIKNDRGKCVRTDIGYANVLKHKSYFLNQSKIINQNFPPYDRFAVELKKF
tara:strand:+ start:28 stop:639 length:612 start_codon:yes stop_codon:yes gene_type:complete